MARDETDTRNRFNLIARCGAGLFSGPAIVSYSRLFTRHNQMMNRNGMHRARTFKYYVIYGTYLH